MTSATLNLRISPRRMLSRKEAAEYCGRGKRFSAECPVAPIRFANGDELFDVRDLDGWIDSLKVGGARGSDDEIVSRLG